MSKLLLHRQVSASAGRESSGSWGGAKATLIRNGHVESHFHIPFDSEDLNDCFFESPGPFDVLFHDNSNGYALFENVSFSSESVELGEIVWQLGANLTVDVSFHGLDLFPDKVSIRHELTGVVYSEDHIWNYKTAFANLMPGKWTITVTESAGANVHFDLSHLVEAVESRLRLCPDCGWEACGQIKYIFLGAGKNNRFGATTVYNCRRPRYFSLFSERYRP